MNQITKVQSHVPARILLVEDDDGDAKAVKRAFLREKIGNEIVRAVDGVEALEMLRGTNGAEKIATPFIVLLDINMPRMNGHEFLRTLRADLDLAKTVVFVLTTSKAAEDVAAAYEQHVAGYIVKETAGRDFLKLVGLVEGFWRIVELPQGG